VVGIDLSSGGNSTFQTAVQSLGAQGSYIDILHEKLNLLEPPNLLDLPPEIQLQRFKRWKDFVRQAIVAIAMGQINDQQLLERVNSIVLADARSLFLRRRSYRALQQRHGAGLAVRGMAEDAHPP
jgi:hypothetical protein